MEDLIKDMPEGTPIIPADEARFYPNTWKPCACEILNKSIGNGWIPLILEPDLISLFGGLNLKVKILLL